MKNLYGSISISKILGDMCIKEYIHYYKLKNRKYGLEIVKKNNINDEDVEVTNMVDITDNEDKIDEVLNELVTKQVTPNLADVIEDLLKVHSCYEYEMNVD